MFPGINRAPANLNNLLVPERRMSNVLGGRASTKARYIHTRLAGDGAVCLRDGRPFIFMGFEIRERLQFGKNKRRGVNLANWSGGRVLRRKIRSWGVVGCRTCWDCVFFYWVVVLICWGCGCLDAVRCGRWVVDVWGWFWLFRCADVRFFCVESNYRYQWFVRVNIMKLLK